jgi:hypothetical protein
LTVVALPQASTSGRPYSLYDRVRKRAAALKTERSGQGWDAHWRDISDHMRPRRSRFLCTDANKGTRINQNIIDSTGVRASTVLTSGMMNGMSNPSQQWFRYEPDDVELMEYGPAKDWIGMLERLARRILHASNAYEALPLVYDELGLFGTGCSVVEDDYEDVIRLNTFTVGEYCLALNKRRRVDTLYREMRMTVIQCVQEFVARRDGSLDWSKCASFVKTQYDCGNYDQWVDVWHCIEPNPDADPEKLDAKNMPFRSLYWDAKDDRANKFLRESGFRDNPIMAPRWSVIGNDVYGRSPGMDALGDVRQLQIMHKRLGEAIDKMVNPPTQGPPALQDRFVSRLPGAHTTVADMSQGGVKPIYEVKPDVNQLIGAIEDTRARIEDTFFVRDLLAISRMEGVQPKNQMEIAERKGEGLMVLGPVVERSQNELLSPLHNRIINRIVEVSLPFWQMGEAGMIPPPPPELQGMPLQIQYQSALAIVQKQTATQGLERLAGQALALVQAFPDVAQKFDAAQYLDEYNEAVNGASRVIRPDNVVAEIAAQQEQQQQAEQLMNAMPALKDGAAALKSLGETPVGGGQGALEAMLGQGQGQDSPPVA